MKRGDLERHLRAHGCSVDREGRRHTVWVNGANGRKDAVPRHSEIKDFLVSDICAQLGVPPVKR